MTTERKVKTAETCYLMVLEFVSPKIKCEKKCITQNAKIHLFSPSKHPLNLAKGSYERNSHRKEELTMRMHLTYFRELTAKGRPPR